jgi:toxin ParE1/3/4
MPAKESRFGMPSSRRLRFTRDADADFEDILQYTAETWGELQMHAYSAVIYGVINDLLTFPGMGKRREDLAPGLLSHPAGQHLIFYRATDDELVVHRIIHGRRDIQPGLID